MFIFTAKNQQRNRNDDRGGDPMTVNFTPTPAQDALNSTRQGERFFSRLRLFWRFQMTGWIAFSVLSFPFIFWQPGTVFSALFLGLIVNGVSFLLTLGIRLIFHLFWTTGHAYLLGIIIVSCGFAGIILIGILFAVHQMRVVDANLFTDSTAIRFFYEHTGTVLALSFLCLGIRRALDEVQPKSQDLHAEEQLPHAAGA